LNSRYYRRVTVDKVAPLVAAGWQIVGATAFSLSETGVLMFTEVNHGLNDEWHSQWVDAWALIGWIASTDLLQQQMMIALVRLSSSTRDAIRECVAALDNFKVQIDWLIKTGRKPR